MKDLPASNSLFKEFQNLKLHISNSTNFNDFCRPAYSVLLKIHLLVTVTNTVVYYASAIQ